MAGTFKRCESRFVPCGVIRLECRVYEDSVIAVNFRRTQLFAVNRYDSLALFTGRFSKQLFKPSTEPCDAWRSNQGQLIASQTCERAKNRSQRHARIIVRRHIG